MARKFDPGLSETRRKQILEATVRCVVRKGFHQTTMQDVCTEADMSPGGVYRYFEGKEAIILAIAEEERRDSREIIDELDRTKDLIGSLRVILFEILKFFADESYGRLAVELLAEAARNKTVWSALARNERELKDALTAALARAQKSGQITSKLSAGALGQVILAMIDGLCARAILDPDYKPVELAATVDAFVIGLLQPRD
ncbi:TetR/AcrR family transcriptional regulator [Pelagibius sp. Alg239-R121]|uniref:TetR/AcrR family transcriptional regulator n=1 Tax=Pelagibius sp. Alg239-R121 TaxID=2993448 RepID=UPI0024A700A1|nr:TetR/AcrR family transcriptional regulator [Pelagibius sp. Alg239-R121]